MKGEELLGLYNLMMKLSSQSGADDALLERRGEGTVGVVLEFNISEEDDE